VGLADVVCDPNNPPRPRELDSSVREAGVGVGRLAGVMGLACNGNARTDTGRGGTGRGGGRISASA
jgi:hypothetical protein